ncbi:MAG: chromosome segregation protein SMC [Caldilineaceae bacterium]
MFIKRVVIQGFKTFAKRTEFIFETGITAVVGPNGSGKSNIVDAVRWCLGEQSFSMLRSKKTSDVIFSGSDKRARLGMAEVSLILDNSMGQVPLDFLEIEITRRAYRDGNNEYLLNGKRVRLQDITELLGHTGLSKRTYAVIGQGLIDRVLNLAPEERRTLFEEAAGITGYQHKRTTTLNRLEATQQNLVRVHDILSELSPRLKYLQRQAERAREYERIATDLRSMLRDWYGFRWHKTLHALEDHGKIELDLRQVVTQRQQALAVLEKELDALRARQANIREQLADLHQVSSERHQRAEQSSRELAVANERLHQLQTRLEEAERELTTLLAEQQAQQTQRGTLENRLAEEQQLLIERQEAVSAAQSAVDQRQQERLHLQGRLETARNALQTVQSRRIDCQSRLRQLQERKNSLESEQVAQRDAEANATADVAAQSTALAEHEARVAATEAAAAGLEQELANLQTARGETQKQLQAAEREQQNAARTLDRLQTRHDLLKRLHDEGAGYASGVRAVVQVTTDDKNSALSGVLGVIATLVHVPAELDKAIETALGGALQNVVTTTWQDAQRAIDYLKESGRGRATFLPLDRLHVPSAIPAPRVDGILGNAADLVDFDEGVADAVLQLLNRVWVAENLPVARRALDNYRNRLRPTVVTLSGEIIRPGGAVTGGNDANRRDDSLLARERELRGLPTEITTAERAFKSQQERCAGFQQTLEQQRTQLVTAEQSRSDLLHQEREGRRQLEDVRRQLDRAQQTVQWHANQVAKQIATLAQLSEAETAATTEQAQIQVTESSAAATLAAAESAVAQAGVAELLQEVAELRAAAATTQTQVKNHQEALEAQKRNLQRLADQIIARDETIQRLRTEYQSLGERIAEVAQSEAGLRAELDALRIQIEPFERNLADAEAERSHKEEVERQTQQALRKDESSWNNARLQLQRTEDALHQLQHEIEQDLGLVVVEQSDSLAYQPPLELDAVVEQLPILDALPNGFEDDVRETRRRLGRLTNVNPDALREYDEAAERHEFLVTQIRRSRIRNRGYAQSDRRIG